MPNTLTPKKSRPLTIKQAAFRDAILGGFPPSQAYRKAFDAKAMSKKAIANEAQKLLKHPKITLAITLATRTGIQPTVLPPLSPSVRLSMQERLEVLQYAAKVDPADYFDDLNHFRPIREMPKHVRLAIAGFKVDPLSFVTEVKFVDRINAVRLYSQLAGDIPSGEVPPAPPTQARYDPSKLTKEEWEAYKRIRNKALVEFLPNGHAR